MNDSCWGLGQGNGALFLNGDRAPDWDDKAGGNGITTVRTYSYACRRQAGWAFSRSLVCATFTIFTRLSPHTAHQGSLGSSCQLQNQCSSMCRFEHPALPSQHAGNYSTPVPTALPPAHFCKPPHTVPKAGRSRRCQNEAH